MRWDATPGVFVPGDASSLANVRLAKTAAYTLLNADKGATVALGGSAFYQLTVGAASGFDADFMAILLNEDTVRAKKIAASGLTDFFLYPGQSAILYNQNNTWRTLRQTRWKIPSGTILYVDGASGSDANDGLASGASALATPQAAINRIKADFDLSNVGSPIIVQLADGTYTVNNAPVIMVNGFFFGAQPSTFVFPSGQQVQVLVKGNATTPANVVLSSTGTGDSAILCLVYGLLGVQDLKVTSSSGHGIHLGMATLMFSNIIFGATAGSKIMSGHSSVIENYGPAFFEGNSQSVLYCDYSSSIYLVTHELKLLGNFAVSQGFARAEQASEISIQGVASINLNGFAVTGFRFITRSNGAIRTGSLDLNFFPGNATGINVGWGSYDNLGTIDLPYQWMEFKGLGTGSVSLGEGPSNAYGAIRLAGPLSGADYNLTSGPADTNLYVNRPTGNDILFRENNASAPNQMILTGTNGRLGIGTNTPTSKLHVVGLPVYANNAAAVTGGLTAGSFYRTNGDPDLVCVVH